MPNWSSAVSASATTAFADEVGGSGARPVPLGQRSVLQSLTGELADLVFDLP
jgi:hypothetical protein